MFDPQEGERELAQLVRENAQLEARLSQGHLTLEDLIDAGWVRISDREVTDKAGQKMPYVEVDLPFARTGFYLPTAKRGRAIDPHLFQGIVIALPGIGAEVSTAKSLFEVSGTLNKGSHPSMKTETGHLRFISIPTDAPLNGLAEQCPYGFGHPFSIMSVLHHVRLVAGAMFPGKPVFMIGRSQGGLNVIEYASLFDDVAAVVALNPSHPDPRVVNYSIELHENFELASSLGFDINLHAKSWQGHADYTSLYTFRDRSSKASVMIQLGTEDKSYPQEIYRPLWLNWVAEDPMRRVQRTFTGGHNLWMRPRGEGEALYQDVIGSMVEFFRRHLP